ncbi:hypothetical protein MAPG_09481 [Magnaporthiopsis poae ATCC 64411]|uniref:Uncharacterized protein n=1 Tax=Magnaporthiopsis poae (strain ATCC 64411 / 73-15) TaxID=644358 RepID=A0A0C4EA26_MAGP6|nr:hypothetical protein MAPG_09481 [Magnaporthiopsis poae ATCC 64411]
MGAAVDKDFSLPPPTSVTPPPGHAVPCGAAKALPRADIVGPVGQAIDVLRGVVVLGKIGQPRRAVLRKVLCRWPAHRDYQSPGLPPLLHPSSHHWRMPEARVDADAKVLRVREHHDPAVLEPDHPVAELPTAAAAVDDRIASVVSGRKPRRDVGVRDGAAREHEDSDPAAATAPLAGSPSGTYMSRPVRVAPMLLLARRQPGRVCTGAWPSNAGSTLSAPSVLPQHAC